MTYYPAGKGRSVTWLRERATYEGDDCLLWPFSTDGRGYGQFGHEGVMHKAHRFMCILAHGSQPNGHEAAHDCGNGLCCNPRHLSWKTRSGNQRDRRRHGTDGPHKGKRHKLTPEKVAEIRKLQGKETVTALAQRFGVTRSTIRQVHLRKTWWIDGQRTPQGWAVTPPRRLGSVR